MRNWLTCTTRGWALHATLFFQLARTKGSGDGKMTSSSGTNDPLDAKDDELSEEVGDDVVRLFSEQNLGSDNNEMENAEDNLINDKEAATPVNPLSTNAAQILPMLHNLLLSNQIQRERLIGLIQLYDPTAEDINANVNTEGEQIATETDLSSQVHFLEQSVEKLKEEIENQKKANAELEDKINRLTMNNDE